MEEEPLSSAIPIIIGVTGHGDLQPGDLPELEAAVGKILKGLLKKYPNTPLLVLSPLAEGADRLVARVALQQRAQLVVPLPMPRSEYEKDFESAESKDEFDRLLKEARECFELPLVQGNTLASIQRPGTDRDKQYAQVGAFVACHCQILIALWDGVDTGLVGGTAEIVRFKREGIAMLGAPPRNPLDIVDTGPVYHIVTPRKKNPNPSGRPFTLNIEFPKAWEDEGQPESPDDARDSSHAHNTHDPYAIILDRMNTYNRDAQRHSPKLQLQIARNREYLVPDAKSPSLPDTARAILRQYAMADTLAIYFQNRRRWTLKALFSIAVMAVASFEVYAHLLNNPWVLALYPASLGIAFLIYFFAQRKEFQNKHLDYRALAEGLRVQLFWNLAGLSDDVAEHYLLQHRTDLEWIRNAIRAWNAETVHVCGMSKPLATTTGVQQQAKLLREIVLEHWVEDQRKFFSRATKRDTRKLDRQKTRIKWLFGCGLGLASLVVILDWRIHEFKPYLDWHGALILAMGTAPAIAAALGGYAEKMALSAQAKRYHWMNALFKRASDQLRAFLDQNKLKEAQQLILELGKEALEENGGWVITHRERTPTAIQ